MRPRMRTAFSEYPFVKVQALSGQRSSRWMDPATNRLYRTVWYLLYVKITYSLSHSDNSLSLSKSERKLKPNLFGKCHWVSWMMYTIRRRCGVLLWLKRRLQNVH